MDVRLRNAASPRLILVGGSNLSLGINSQMLKDSLALNPINTGISVGIGLCYMLDNTLKHVRKNDIVVVHPNMIISSIRSRLATNIWLERYLMWLQNLWLAGAATGFENCTVDSPLFLY